MCRFGVDKRAFERKFRVGFDAYFSEEQEHLRWCADNDLLHQDSAGIDVLELGKIFIRNVCMGFDHYLRQDAQQKFSRTI
jgi:oxygen-independent coproporphyrinogen-3 oxidase